MNTNKGDMMNTTTPTPTEPTAYPRQLRDIYGRPVWYVLRPEFGHGTYTPGTWSHLVRLGLDLRDAMPYLRGTMGA